MMGIYCFRPLPEGLKIHPTLEQLGWGSETVISSGFGLDSVLGSVGRSWEHLDLRVKGL